MAPGSLPRTVDRRALLSRLAALGLGGAAAWAVRVQMAWPTPEVRFARGLSSGWIALPEPGGLIALPARIGWARVQAVVDSGAQYSAIDEHLADRLGLASATPFPMIAFGVSGTPRLTRSVRLDLDLQGVALKGLRAATLGLRSLSGLTRQPFSVLLGRDVLQGVVVEADFPSGRVAFHQARAWSPPPQAQRLPVRLHGSALMASVSVEGGPPVEVMVDTGATGPLALSEDTARAAGLLDGRPLRQGESVTIGGVGMDGVVSVRGLSFAGRELGRADVQIYRPASHAPVPAGLVGMGVLRRFHLAFDCAQGRLFVIPPQEGG
jgi:predicted aspartyl protease